jgi:hypothetical protein
MQEATTRTASYPATNNRISAISQNGSGWRCVHHKSVYTKVAIAQLYKNGNNLTLSVSLSRLVQ